MVECLTRDQRAAGSSLTGVTALWSLSKTHLSLLSTGSTQEDSSLYNWKIVDGTYGIKLNKQNQSRRMDRTDVHVHFVRKVILRILRKSPNILTRAWNIAIVFLWSIIHNTPRCLVYSEVVICNQRQNIGLIFWCFLIAQSTWNSGWNIYNSQKHVICSFVVITFNSR